MGLGFEGNMMCESMGTVHGYEKRERLWIETRKKVPYTFNYYGYFLPTEGQWQAVADYDGSFLYGCGPTISQSIANYEDAAYANPLSLSSPPYTSLIGYYTAHGYGMHDMAGNVQEWTSTNVASNRIVKGGGWDDNAAYCTVTTQFSYTPHGTSGNVGFRVCRNNP